MGHDGQDPSRHDDGNRRAGLRPDNAYRQKSAGSLRIQSNPRKASISGEGGGIFPDRSGRQGHHRGIVAAEIPKGVACRSDARVRLRRDDEPSAWNLIRMVREDT